MSSFSSLAGFLAANPGWSLPDPGSSPTPAIIGLGPGLFDGGTLILHGIPGGANAEYIIIAWTGAFTTYDAAYAAHVADPSASFIGLSPICYNCNWRSVRYSSSTPNQPEPHVPRDDNGRVLVTVLISRGSRLSQQARRCLWVPQRHFMWELSPIPAPYYQWYFNGMSIPGATGSSFQISNAQLTNAGTYWVVLSSPYYGLGRPH